MQEQQQNQYYAIENENQTESQQYKQPQAFSQDYKKEQIYSNQNYFVTTADFVKKVYCLLTLELIITLGIIALGLYSGMQSWLVQSQEEVLCFCSVGQIVSTRTEYCDCDYYPAPSPKWLFYVSLVFAIILLCMMSSNGNLGMKIREPKIIFVVLLLQIIFYGFMLTTICVYFAYYCGTAIVWQAWGITLAIVFGLTFYACISQTSVSFGIAAIFILFPTFFMTIIYLCFWPSFALYIFLCSLFVVIQGFYLIWETAFIIREMNTQTTDYVIGSLFLYVTILIMFVRILKILAALKRN